MKKTITIVAALILIVTSSQAAKAQSTKYAYEVSPQNPYGKLNPDAPSEVADYELLIGTCDCLSYSKNLDNGTWAPPVNMEWTFKYIMNGTAVQDGTLKSDESHAGSIRLYQPDSAKWYIHYFNIKKPTSVLAVWSGGNKGDEIVLLQQQKAPNGLDGFYKIRFYDISERGFSWIGAWTTPNESFVIETLKIECKKRKT